MRFRTRGLDENKGVIDPMVLIRQDIVLHLTS